MFYQLKLNVFVFVALCIASTLSAEAQIDSVLLDSTVISLRGVSNGSAIKSIQLKNKTSLGDVLTQESLVFVKPTGGSALSTISIRGGTPEQSPIFWNGLNLQNTLNGNVDIALLPSFVFDEVTVNTISATNSGSGVIAGSVELKNTKLDTVTSIDLKGGIGSFGLLHAAIKSTIPTQTGTWTFTGYHRSAKNNYPYRTTSSGSNTKLLDHSSFSLNGLLIKTSFALETTTH